MGTGIEPAPLPRRFSYCSIGEQAKAPSFTPLKGL